MTTAAAAVTFAGNERESMINEYHARIIDRLREAAKEHGEVADLLMTIAECFPGLGYGDASFDGDDKGRAYLAAAIDAWAFVAIDKPTVNVTTLNAVAAMEAERGLT